MADWRKGWPLEEAPERPPPSRPQILTARQSPTPELFVPHASIWTAYSYRLYQIHVTVQRLFRQSLSNIPASPARALEAVEPLTHMLLQLLPV